MSSLVLPDIVELNSCGGNFDRYETILHNIYLKIFAPPPLKLNGKSITPIVNPRQHKGRHFSFGHMTSTGPVEEDRDLDLRRCERLCWVRPILANIKHGSIKLFRQRRRSKNRIVIWLQEKKFAIVLDDRGKYYALITTYIVSSNNTLVYQNEYEQFLRDVQNGDAKPI